MKLNLTSENGVAILQSTGEISEHEVEVLKAGLTKLLKSGKNRIVLEFSGTESFPAQLIHEIAKFDLLARELSGRVVLTGGETFRKKVRQLAPPSSIECLTDRKAALQSLSGKPKTAPATPAAHSTETLQQVNNLTPLHKRIAELEEENRLLSKQLHAAWLNSHSPPNLKAQQGELDALREKMEEILEYAKTIQEKGN